MNQSNENHQQETEEILRDCIATREDDTLLMLKVWRQFHPSELNDLLSARTDEELLAAFRRLPKEDSIKRYRRTFREKYPSSKAAEQRRREQEAESVVHWAGNQGMMFPVQQDY